jgi:hypothetical protein
MSTGCPITLGFCMIVSRNENGQGHENRRTCILKGYFDIHALPICYLSSQLLVEVNGEWRRLKSRRTLQLVSFRG